MKDLKKVEYVADELDIAIIGMTGRFPGANNLKQFWQNLQDGVESISFFSDEELEVSGINPVVLSDPNYVKAKPIIEGIELFDASFFGYSPKEAEFMDPQHRLFLECAWEAFETAGCDPNQGSIGVYAGASTGASSDSYYSYLLNFFSKNPDSNHNRTASDAQFIGLGNNRDFLSTRVSYKLNLKGPSYTIQTACSTSLVAVHLACQSLLNSECEIALAGGITIDVRQKAGYKYQQEDIMSPDGHCRAFDAGAQGTVFGSGVGIVVLKRLKDALADGDCIHAVIKGSAINNDGSLKVSYTAPSVDGQAEVIVEAISNAGIEPDTVTYVETHGTGTVLGDPIEIQALTKAFRASTLKKNYCAIGSVKTNVGHLNAAAGVTALIKTILALKHKQIPPSLHFKEPNPEIDFANSPFYVNTQLCEWKANGTPRRAGVSSFGFGGTNAHMILEEAPVIEPSGPSRSWQLLLLSAKTSSALETATVNLVTYLEQHPDLTLADVAYTLQVGRRVFDHRRMLLCRNVDDAVKVLDTKDPQRVFTHFQEPCNRQVVFMFPGQGSQYVNMGRELYETEPIFRKHIDKCCVLLKSYLDFDLRTILYPSKEQTQAAQQLQQTHITQPALFVIEYALAKLWIAWGICPAAMIGHSIGEYVAATLAGVFSLEDALALVAARGQLMQQLPSGAMLSVPLSEEEIQLWLSKEITLAGINAPSLCVVSGSEEAIAKLQSRLTQQGVECRRLHTSHAFHSQMMDSILEPFTKQVEKVKLNPPQIPFISNLTGTWITAEEAINPSYWAKHLRQTVRFAANIAELIKESEQILLEVGPGRTLSTFAKQQTNESMVLTSMRHPKDKQSDVAFLLNTLGRLWLAGVQVDWDGFYALEQRHRIPLPTYPFERQRYWIEPQITDDTSNRRQIEISKKPNIADWFYLPSWKQAKLLEPFKGRKPLKQKSCRLVFVDPCKLGSQIAQRLEQEGEEVITVTMGEKFTQLGERTYVINPQQRQDYDALFQTLRTIDKIPQTIAHFWGVTANTEPHRQSLSEQTQSVISSFEKYQTLGFYSLLFIAQALSKQNVTTPLQMMVVTNNVHDAIAQEELIAEKGTVLGPCKVIPQEYSNITCRNIDIVIPAGISQENQLINQLMAELTAESSDLIIAYRGRHRWVQTSEPAQLKEVEEETTRLREGGIYLIAGKLVGSLGLVFAEHLAQTLQAKLILIGNIGLPQRNEWSQWLETHEEHDTISYYIRKILALEQLGAELLIIEADVANVEQMQAAINQAYEYFGQIHGVFYATPMGNEKSAFSIQEIGRTESESQFHSKVYGLYVLEKVLQGKELDFYLLQSSLSSIVGGLGLVAYSAANLFIDTFVNKRNQTSSIPWFNVNWDAVKYEQQQEKDTGLGATLAELTMTPKEVWDVSRRVLSMGSAGQFIVSPGDLQARLNTWIKREYLHNTDNSQEDALSQYSRPNLQTAYVAPSNEIEQTIANIWQELLGVKQVGIHDNFFELGGHSLLAVQVTSRLRENFQVELPLQSILFDAPTVAGLAVIIAETQPKQEELQEIAALLQEVISLSPEEIQQELVAES